MNSGWTRRDYPLALSMSSGVYVLWDTGSDSDMYQPHRYCPLTRLYSHSGIWHGRLFSHYCIFLELVLEVFEPDQEHHV